MEDLPDLPFDEILDYLDLVEVIRARAVSKKFYLKINHFFLKFRVRNLLLSDTKRGFPNTCRLFIGKFAQNFINSSRFADFDRSVLSDLRHLCACELDLKFRSLEFIELVNSFKKLESLIFVEVTNLCGDFKLILPKLKSIHANNFRGRFALTLDTPSLSEIKIWECSPCLKIMYPDSVETLAMPDNPDLALKFKNLKFLYCEKFVSVSDTFISSLKQLKEIRLHPTRYDNEIFDRLRVQKERYGRSELKISLEKFLASSSYTSPILNSAFLKNETLRILIAGYSRLADQLPNYRRIYYSDIEPLPEIPAAFWRKLINLEDIDVVGQVKNMDQFLDLLRACPAIQFLDIGTQPQNLLDQLPTYCSNLENFHFHHSSADLDFTFILGFKKLRKLRVKPVDVYFIKKIFEKLNFMQTLWFECGRVSGFVWRNCEEDGSKRFYLTIEWLAGEAVLNDVDGVVKTIVKYQTEWPKLKKP